MRKITFGACAATIAMLLGACGASFDRDEAIADLEEGGLDRATAECVVDGVEDSFGIDRLESTDDLTSEDEAILFEIMTNCITGG